MELVFLLNWFTFAKFNKRVFYGVCHDVRLYYKSLGLLQILVSLFIIYMVFNNHQY